MAAALALAGQTIAVRGLTTAQTRSLVLRYGDDFRTGIESGDSAITVRSDTFPDRDTRGWEYSIDLLWHADGFSLDGWRVRARFSGTQGEVWTSVGDEPAFWSVLENVLRPWLAWRLFLQGGLLVHSAAVDGVLFPGRSGAGKSTIARLGRIAGRPVLSDDLNALRDGTIAPLPFTGDLARHELSREAAPLRAIVALEHGDREEVRDLAASHAAALLVRCAPYVNADPHRAVALLDRAAEIARAVPCGVLTFRRDGDVWPILRRWHDHG